MPVRLSPTLVEAKERACEALMRRAGPILANGGLSALSEAVEAVRAARSVAEVGAVLVGQPRPEEKQA